MDAPEEFKPFFTALADQQIAFPRCEACQRFHWYPMLRCPHCFSDRITWQKVGSEATVYTWTVYRREFLPSWKGTLPNVVGLVEFRDAPGIRLVTQLINAAPESWRVGDRVKPVFGQVANDVPVVLFEAA